MVHTANFYVAIHREIRDLLEVKFGDSITLIQDKVNQEIGEVLQGLIIERILL